jgi:hypothetical protein
MEKSSKTNEEVLDILQEKMMLIKTVREGQKTGKDVS